MEQSEEKRFESPMYRFPATIALILLNLVAFLITWLHAGSFATGAWQLSLLRLGGLFTPYTLDGEWYRIFLSMFLHGHAIHLLMNMIALFFVGRDLESEIASLKFLLVYFIAGAGACIASLYWSMFTMSVGASGAVFGLFGFSLVNTLVHGHRQGHSLAPTLINFVVFIFINLAVGEAFHADHVAHFGGLVSGGILAACSHFIHPTLRSIRSEYVMAVIFILVYILLPRYQVKYYQFFKQVVKAEREGKAIAGSSLSDNQFLKRLQFNNLQWDSASQMLDHHDHVPSKLSNDTATLRRYIQLRALDNDYRIRMIRDENYILMDSIGALQDSIVKYLHLEYPVPLMEGGVAESPDESMENPDDPPPQREMIRVWYDSNWIETDLPGPYYRIGYRDSSQRWQGRVEDFYADGITQMKGFYRDGKRDGIFLYYSHHHTYTSAGRYADNRSIGKWQTFHNNGRLKTEIVYGEQIFLRNMWDSAGHLQVKNGRGRVVEYFSDGRTKEEGEYINGAREGIWTGWHANGQLHFKEDYRRGMLVLGKSRNLSGDEFTYDGSSLVPVPAKGFPFLQKFIAEKTRETSPAVVGTVRLSFRVTANGELTDFEVERSVDPEIDQNAISILKAGPKWLPAREHGYLATDGFAWVDVRFGSDY
jgi:membrane associated rhomboid family serine protease